MRISSQKVDLNIQRSNNVQIAPMNNMAISDIKADKAISGEKDIKTFSANNLKDESKAISKEKVQQAVESINEFIAPLKTSSKFVYHEGLDEYYVRVVDSETEEVIKEIPPEKLLNAFYEMQKLAGMIVDEKI